MIRKLAVRCLTFTVALSSICFSASVYGQTGFGEKIVNNGTEIYYTGQVAKEDAERLGEYLTECDFSDGNTKSVQLVNEYGTWQFRMVTQEKFVDDAEMNKNFNYMCLQLSTVFNGEDVDIHVCNDSLETLKVVQGHRGELNKLNETEVYYLDVNVLEMTKIEEFLGEYGFKDKPGTFYVQKLEDRVKFHMVAHAAATRDQAVLADCKALSKVLSKEVFGGKIVEYHLCNEYLQSVNFVTGRADNF